MAALLVAGNLAGCFGGAAQPDVWAVEATVEPDHVSIVATISHYHTDYIHMSIRKRDWDNQYSVDRSPSPMQPSRDWSRVHHWFGELHPHTYLEGRIDDGSGQGPEAATTVRFELPRSADPERRDLPDADGSGYVYVTNVYSYADGHTGEPSFGPGAYEVEIYAWYTGSVDDQHPAIDDSPEVQYLHYEAPFVSTTFVIE